MARQLLSKEGELFELGEDESALCIMLEGDDACSAPVPVYGANPNEGPLPSVRLRSVVELLKATIKLLPPSMPPSERETLRTQGLPRTNSDPTTFDCNVHGIPGDIQQISRLLGDIRWLDCPLPKSILARRMASQLITHANADSLRNMLEANNDLTPDEKRAAHAEPLFTADNDAPSADDAPAAPPMLNRSISYEMDGGIPDEGNVSACLELCDARTLRKLKPVSKLWRRRARKMLGDAHSPWRREPIYLPSDAAAGLWAAYVGAQNNPRRDARRDALREIAQLDLIVEPPE